MPSNDSAPPNGVANGTSSNGTNPQSSDSFRSYMADCKVSSKDSVYTTSNGVPVPHPFEAQRAGQNGPLLLQDFHLIDLLAGFNRERIPERVVHARGSGAHGTFTCTDPLDDLCVADIFSAKGKTCPLTVRFSTVGGESGTGTNVPDPRGFSVKLRTAEGNMDWVFNNTPAFFIASPAKFPNLIHTQKRNPASHRHHTDDSTMFWDYFSQNPESVHQVMILMGDRGIPKNWRSIHGYSGHSFKLVNKNNEWVYCQIHLKSQQTPGAFFTQKEAGEQPPDVAEVDLYDAIERGEHPSWSVEVQTMTPAEAEQLWETDKINVLNLTHVWPQKKFPLRKVGEFTLTSNPQNYFAEVEQLCFSPAHLVPGIEPSADPVLQSRLFSYSDAHRYRVGVNYQQLPVNAPNVPYHAANFQRDGSMAFVNSGSRPNYYASADPISFRKGTVDLNKVHGEFVGKAITFLDEIRPEDFNAPRALWERVFDDGAKERFVENVSGHMANCKDEEIKKRQIAIFRTVSEDLGARLEKAMGIKGYKDISDIQFLGTINAMSAKQNGSSANGNNQNIGAPVAGTHGKLGLVH